jgi:GntR family transcriptional regulator
VSSKPEGGRHYRDIADGLREAILAGEYRPGDRLPGENTLMREEGVARETARKALSVLINEGLVYSRRGVGVFVAEFKPIRRQGTTRLSRELWAAGTGIWEAEAEGRTLTLSEVRVYRADSPPHAARVLDLDDGAPVWVRSRIFVLDDKPVMAATSYLPAAIVEGSTITQPDTGPGGTYARLKDLGYEPARFREEIRVRMPLPDERDRLRLPAGVPVIMLHRTAFTRDGRAVELNEMTMDAGSYILEYVFDA